MLLQTVGNKVIVYVENYSRDFIDVAAEFGMVENNALASYVKMTTEPYVNSFGYSIPSVHLNGKTVDIHVVNDTVKMKSGDAASFANALNMFPPQSRFTLNGHTFVSRFYETLGILKDVAGRSLSFQTKRRKDLRNIYGLMTHLGDNNGRLYEPVITRFVYTSYQMPRHRQLVGYFDLEKYLFAIHDPRRAEFFSTPLKKDSVLVYLECGNTPPSVTVTNVVNGCAELEIRGLAGSYDAKKLNEFRPYIVLTRRPLEIKTMKFPWTKVHFDKVDVFMTPILSLSDAWESLEGGIDLLAPPTGTAKNLVF